MDEYIAREAAIAIIEEKQKELCPVGRYGRGYVYGADREKAGRAQQTKEIFEWQQSAQALHDDLLAARERANYAEAHPWRNLWVWLKRKMVRHE